MMKDKIPCKGCITYALCKAKDRVDCKLLDTYCLYTKLGPSNDRIKFSRDYLGKDVAQIVGLTIIFGNVKFEREKFHVRK